MIVDLQSNNLLKVIYNRYVINQGLKYGWKANNAKAYDQGHWNTRILNGSKNEPFDHELMPFINKHTEVKQLWHTLKQYTSDAILLRCYINGYTFGTDGYAHKDDTWIPQKFGEDALSETIIVYLNDTWNIDWAGETVIFTGNNEIEQSVLPKFGRVFIFNSNKLHAARPLSRLCPVLRTVLVYKTATKSISSVKVEWLVKHTVNISHTDKTLFEHLYNTMLRLENSGASECVRSAGLFHSIYDTEYFKANLSLSRETIQQLIGTYSETLVYEFCTLTNRLQSLLTNSNNYSDSIVKDLLLIERANLEDQNSTGKYNKQLNDINTKLGI